MQIFNFLRNPRFIWFIIFIIGVGFRASHVMHPIDTESWRESDISLMAKNYYENGMDFFHPQVNWGNGPGYVESEFPLYPYLIALVYKIFGFYEPAGRLISLFFSIATLLVFFKFSRYIFNTQAALLVSFFFSISPLPNIIGSVIQSEPMMFFFYVCAAWFFLKWIDKPRWKYYLLAILCTSLALLLKITAIHIGFLFVMIILLKKNRKFIIRPQVIILGILCLAPSVLWYYYSHQFYLEYGNSLGISNEYSFMGTDFFTNIYFVKGILKLEKEYIWLYTGLVLTILSILLTDIYKHPAFIFAICWLVSVFIFYAVTSRTTADYWAYYYHIFSSPASAILMGLSLYKLREWYLLKAKNSEQKSFIRGNRISMVGSIAFIIFFLVHSFLSYRTIISNKEQLFTTSKYYYSLNDLSKLIPSGNMVLASGNACMDKNGYPVAYNSSYFFYWLNCRGSNICTDDQSIKAVMEYKNKGINYYIAETWALSQKAGFCEELKTRFKVIYDNNGIVVFKLTV